MKQVALVAGMLCVSFVVGQAAGVVEPAASLARMPIKEVTVFKDGHAFVVHQGRLPTDAAGRVVLDRLPTPVLGTFWPYSAERDVKLASVTASRRRVAAEQTATDLRGLMEANPGAAVEIVDVDGKVLSGRLRGLPARPVDELEAGEGAGGGELLPARGNLVMIETGQGLLALPVERVRSVSFKSAPAARFTSESYRSLLAMSFAWPDARPRHELEVGMAYVQKGLRWIPSYRVTIGATGKAHVQLQATLVNELADLDQVTAHLVIGVPNFAFKDVVDPMALQQTLARLGGYFDAGSASGYAMSNAIMSQAARVDDSRLRESDSPAVNGLEAAVPVLSGSEKDEDLFVFTVKGVTLARGERMVLPVAEYDLAYRDVYVLDLPFGPPVELQGNTSESQQRELQRLLGAPRFTHVLRLANSAHDPLTTAPALITSGDRVLGQGMMTYTAPGGDCDLDLTTAVDLQVSKRDKETGRTPGALVVDGSSYMRVELQGTIAITNRSEQAVDIEVRRSVLGHADAAGQAGRAEMLNAYEERGSRAMPPWWGWYGWPGWWSAVNGLGQFSWKTRVDKGARLSLTYNWHYFWR